jgi:ABC-type multidrug transport system fused ATPase/permease subunit
MFLRSVCVIGASIIALFVMSPILALTMCTGMVPVAGFSLYTGHKMRELAKEVSAEKAKMSTIADESLGNIRTVKAFANEEEELRKFSVGSDEVYKLGVQKAYWMGFFGFFTQACLYGAMALIIYVASILYERGEITIGTITSFLFYMIMMLFNFWILSFVYGNAMQVVGASDKIVKVMQKPHKINSTGGIKLPEEEVQGRIELRNVKFHYPSNDTVQVLKGVNIEVDNKKNRVVALCGTSGCGKSSIISMIERFYDPTEGEVLFNGVNIKELDPRWYHEQVVIVQQEPVLFSGTIRDNILYGLDLSKYTEEQLIAMMDQACRDANAYNFTHDLDLFPLIYDTVVGERGVKLSGG